jgi:hypothetical protein
MRLYLFVDPDWPTTDASPRDLVELVCPAIVTLHSPYGPSHRLGEELRARGGIEVEVLPLQGMARAPKIQLAAVCAVGAGELPHPAQTARLRLHGIPTAILRPRTGSLYDHVDGWARFSEQSDLEALMGTLRGLYSAFSAHHDPIRTVAGVVALAKQATTRTTLLAAWMELETMRVTYPVLAPWLAGPEKMLRAWVERLAA